MPIRDTLEKMGIIKPEPAVFSIPELPQQEGFDNRVNLANFGVTCRRFILKRSKDGKGMSGTGIVAEGVEFTNGACVLHWLTHISTTSIYDSIKAIEYLHGHGKSTSIIYLD